MITRWRQLKQRWSHRRPRNDQPSWFSFRSPGMFVFGLLSILGLTAPMVAQANLSLGNAFVFIIAVPIYGYLTMLGGLLWTAGKAITWLLNTSLDVVNYFPVTVGWQTSRDVVNMLIIIVLLYVIFATVFGSSVAYKQVLPRVLIAAILVNFSRLIVSIPIELSNVLVRTFMPESLRGNLTESLLGALGVGAFWQVRYDIPELGTIDLLAGLFFNVVVFTVLAAAIIGVVIMFFIRLVVYMFLTVLAPFVFILGAIPNKQLAGLRNEWVSALTGWSIYGPVVAFFLMIALRVAQSELGQIAQSDINAFRHPFVTEASFESILVLVLVIVLLFAAMSIGQKLKLQGANLAAKASSAALKSLATRGLPAALSAFSLRNGASLGRRALSGARGLATSVRDGAASGDLVSRGISAAGRGLSATGRAIASGARLGARTIADPGQAVRTAAFLPAAIMQRMAREQKDYADVQGARAADVVNRLRRQPTNLGDQAEQAIFNRRVQELGNLSPDALRDRLTRLSNLPAAMRNPQEMEAAMLAAAQAGVLTGDNGLVNSSSFLNQHRAAIERAAQNDHMFATGGEEKMRKFLLEQYAGSNPTVERLSEAQEKVGKTMAALSDPKRAAETRKQVNELWKANDAEGFATAFQKPDSVGPETMRHALMSHLQSSGMSEGQALSALSRVSSLMVEKGDTSAAGMVKVSTDGTMSLGSKEFHASKIASQVSRTGAKKIMESLKVEDLMSMDANGKVTGLSGNIDSLLANMNVSKGSLNAAENSSAELRQKLMERVTMPDGTQKQVKDLIKQRIQGMVEGRDGSMTGNLNLRLGEMRSKLADSSSGLSVDQKNKLRSEIQTVQAQVNRTKKKAIQSMAHIMALEHAENGVVTAPDGSLVTIDDGKPLSDYRKVAESLFGSGS